MGQDLAHTVRTARHQAPTQSRLSDVLQGPRCVHKRRKITHQPRTGGEIRGVWAVRTNGKWVEAMLSPFPDQPRQLMALRPHDIFDDVMTQLKITARNFDDSMSPAARLHECVADAAADRAGSTFWSVARSYFDPDSMLPWQAGAVISARTVHIPTCLVPPAHSAACQCPHSHSARAQNVYLHVHPQ